MSYEYQCLSVHRDSPASWRVTFDHPPINLVDWQTLTDLEQLAAEVEAADALKVIVFASADSDFFLAHWDLGGGGQRTASPSPAPSWTDISLRFARSPVVSVALIRGRTRGMGSEIALGFDMRFASLERATFGQPEVGVGLVPGGGAMQRLPLLVGRARALEIVLGADDFDAQTAERYGWVNRSLPDADLDAFVAAFAGRIASFDKRALSAAKQVLNRHAVPTAEELNTTAATFREALGWPGTRTRVKTLMELGIGTRSDLELRFGHYLPMLAQDRS
jgi:enoyl-CoA hydratase/carnithine racemase